MSKMIGKLGLSVVALLAMVAGSAFVWPGGASANVSNVTASTSSFDSGDTVQITVTAQDFDGNLEVTTTEGDLDLVSCNVPADGGNCATEVTGEGTPTVVVDTATADDDSGTDPLTLVLTLTSVECEDADQNVTVTAEQDGTDDSVTVTCESPADEGTITIIKDAYGYDDDQEFDFTISGDASCNGSFSLEDGESRTLDCDRNDTYVVTEVDLPAGWSLVDIECDESGGAEVDVDVNNERVTIELPDDEDAAVTCVFYNEEFDDEPAHLTASSNPSVITTCGGSSVVTAYVTTAEGSPVENGTSVYFSTNYGTITSAAQTSGGYATATYTSPSTGSGSAVATIAATVGGGVGAYAQVTVTCNTTTVSAPQTPTTPPAPVQPAPVSRPPVVVSPPSAGDGGLAATNDDATGATRWLALGAAILIPALGVGLVAANRRRI